MGLDRVIVVGWPVVGIKDEMSVSKKVVMRFPKNLVDQPIVCRLVKDHNLVFNILKASVTPNEEGLLVMELNTGGGVDYRDCHQSNRQPGHSDPVTHHLRFLFLCQGHPQIDPERCNRMEGKEGGRL